jgi:hypothetical protein
MKKQEVHRNIEYNTSLRKIMNMCIVATLILSLQGCTDEELPKELLLTTDYFYGQPCDNCYAIVSDENGSVLDYQKINEGRQIMEFYGGTNGATIMLTKISYARFSNVNTPIDYYRLETNQDIPVGSVLMRDKTAYQDTNLPVIGNAFFNLTGYRDSDSTTLSTTSHLEMVEIDTAYLIPIPPRMMDRLFLVSFD